MDTEEIENLKKQVQKLIDSLQTLSIEVERQRRKWEELEKAAQDLRLWDSA